MMTKTRTTLAMCAGGALAALALMLALGWGTGLVEAAPVPAGLAQAATPTVTATPAPVYITVTVQPGDSLVTFTQRYGVSADSLRAVNNISNVDVILPGRLLTIPVVKSFTPSLTTPYYYTVQPGDTLYKIAAWSEVDSGTLAAVNGLSGDIVILGRTYLIPAGPHRHFVQRNESIRSIAERYGTTQAAIINYNNLPNPDKLYIGVPIWIPIQYNANPVPLSGATAPAPGTPVPGATVTAGAPVNVAGNNIKVQVRLGDSLLVYVYRYGVSGRSIVAANPQIKNVDLIYPGDILTIPVTASYTPSRTTPFFYVVSAGETAATIAAKFEMTADTLVGANPGMSLGAGVTLLVPAGPHLYPIKAGDTLPGIAALYNTTEANLANFSNVPNPDRIYAGQQIFIPVIYNSKPMPF